MPIVGVSDHTTIDCDCPSSRSLRFEVQRQRTMTNDSFLAIAAATLEPPLWRHSVDTIAGATLALGHRPLSWNNPPRLIQAAASSGSARLGGIYRRAADRADDAVGRGEVSMPAPRCGKPCQFGEATHQPRMRCADACRRAKSHRQYCDCLQHTDWQGGGPPQPKRPPPDPPWLQPLGYASSAPDRPTPTRLDAIVLLQHEAESIKSCQAIQPLAAHYTRH